MSDRLAQVRALLRKEAEERSAGMAGEVLLRAHDLVGIVMHDDELQEAAAARAVERLPEAWTPVDRIAPPQWSERRSDRRMLAVGDVVKVKGMGKRGPDGEKGIGHGFSVLGIATRNGDVNVVVLRKGKQATVKLERIV